ncbi:MAG: pyruvate kinase [Lachnospiraceae bacterium]|nr:pyruvate kinase [Lachnospiraceae bacterium]
MRKTKMICTAGPSLDHDDEVMKQMMLNGMNCMRTNFSHGDHEEHKGRMDKIKRLRKETGLNIPFLLDTKGPEIRLKTFEEGSVELEKGQTFTFKAGDMPGNKDFVCLSYDGLANDVKPGNLILIDDGKVGLDVVEVKGSDVVCKVQNTAKISDKKSVNVPNVSIKLPYLTEKDKSDIIFGVSQGIDFVAASFVRKPEDVTAIRQILDENGGKDVMIISKIENMEGIENLDEIMDLSDGIMVARGDLGVEVPYHLLPSYQKMIIDKCYRKGKLVVTATQMLETMTSNPRPTRAEVSDVANAIYDNTCCTMLSGETANGDYSAAAVKTMAEIALSTEKSIDYKEWFHQHQLQLGNDTTNAIANAAIDAAHSLDAKAIVVLTRSGKTAWNLSAYRPACPIIAATVSERGARQLNLAWGVTSIKSEEVDSSDKLFTYAVEKAVETEKLAEGDVIVIVAGGSLQEGAPADMIKIKKITKADLNQ